MWLASVALSFCFYASCPLSLTRWLFLWFALDVAVTDFLVPPVAMAYVQALKKHDELLGAEAAEIELSVVSAAGLTVVVAAVEATAVVEFDEVVVGPADNAAVEQLVVVVDPGLLVADIEWELY